jgi:hypothetical protein
MLFLWIFGNNIEDSMSLWRFVLFYLIGGVVAVAAQTALDTSSPVPTIGASGAVSGSRSGLGIAVNGQCPSDVGCTPTGNVTGSHTVLQLHLEVLGAGTFTGQVIAADAFRGNFARLGSNYSIRFARLP